MDCRVRVGNWNANCKGPSERFFQDYFENSVLFVQNLVRKVVCLASGLGPRDSGLPKEALWSGDIKVLGNL